MRIVKKILKWALRVVLIVVGILLLVSFLVFLPPVQKVIKDKASAYVSANMGFDLEVERLRLRFPLTLRIDNTVLRLPGGDTLLHVGQLRAGVAPLALLTGNIEVRRFRLADVGVDYRDSLGVVSIRGTVGEIGVRNTRVKLKDNSIKIGTVSLSGARINMELGESPPGTADSADTTAAAPWHVEVRRLDLDKLAFSMRTAPSVSQLAVALDRGRVDSLTADLARQLIAVHGIQLDKGDYTYLTDTVEVSAAADTLPTPESRPWTVRVGGVELTETSAAYGSLHEEAQPGFDPSHIAVSGLELRMEEIYNRGSDISAAIRSLEFRERSGLEVTGAEGRFAMDSAGIRLSGLDLRTAASTIRADVSAGGAIMEMSPDAPLSALLDVSLSGSDVLLLYPAKEELRRVLRGKAFTFRGDLGGTLGDLKINALTARMPPHFSFDARGGVRSLTDPANIGGSLHVDGAMSDPGFVRDLLPEGLRDRIGFPRNVGIAGNVAIDRETYTPDLHITADGGHADIKGRFDLRAESYDAVVDIREFPLGVFLPADSLGLVALCLTVAGHGFDLTSSATAADMEFEVDRFDYNGYTHHDIMLRAALADNNLSGTLHSANEALRADLDITGRLSREIYGAHLRGRIDRADLQRMRLSDVPLSGAGVFDIDVSATPDMGTLSLDAVLDSLNFRYDDIANRIAHTTVMASADRTVTAQVRSGDLSVDFTSPLTLEALMAGFTQVADTVMRQVAVRNVDVLPVEAAMPIFGLNVKMGRNNVVHSILVDKGFDFRNISLTAANADSSKFRVRGIAEGFRTSSLTLDTLTFGLGERNGQLTWLAHLANRPGNIEQLASIYVYGTAAGDSIRANINQRNSRGEQGFVFGIDARLRDSSLRVGLFTDNPLIAYDTWLVNEGNYIEYHFDKKIYADFSLENRSHPGHIEIRSVDREDMPPGSVRLDIAGLDIGKALELIPAPPPVGGILSTDIAFGMQGPMIAANGSAGVKGLSWERRRVGDIALKANTSADDSGLWTVGAELGINNSPAFAARGTYNMPDGAMNLVLGLPGFPLAAANPFLPSNTATLAGNLEGRVTLRGTASDPDVSGALNFDGGEVAVAMIGTTYGISAQPINIGNGRITMRRFGLTAPNNRLLALDGSVDISDLSRMSADLTIAGRNFEVIDAPRNRRSQVYGLAAIDANLTAKGPIDALVLRGDIKLLRNTDVVYTMADSPLSVDDQKQNIVTFVSFADSTQVTRADTMRRVSTGGMDMLVNVDIDDNVQATVNLSDNGNDRIELVGGGSLTYIMNNQGDTRLAGRYDLTGGTVVYNPPIPMISEKYFTIDRGGYVQWTGEMLDPEFNIRAVETVRTTVDYADGISEDVNFDITILISGSLNRMSTTFDLAAPESYAITDDLASMTVEQRSQEALGMLIRGTYTGPSATAKADSNNALNSFIEKQINQWARNSLKGIDVSVGIRSAEGDDGSTHNDYSYRVSKSLFNDRMKVTVGGSVSDGTSVEGNLSDNLVADVALEYRLTRRDNMFIKGYRSTTTDMLDGQVTETGAGFMVRRQMEKLRELFNLTPSPARRQMRERRDSVRTEERRIIRDTSRRFNRGPLTPEDSLRRAAWRARRDSLGRDSTWRRPPRDPSRFDAVSDSLPPVPPALPRRINREATKED